MGTEAPRQARHLTLTEVVVLYGVLGAIGYAIHGKVGTGCGMALATVVIAQAVWRTIRLAPGDKDGSNGRAEPGAAPNGGPAAPVDKSRPTEGPPSVS